MTIDYSSRPHDIGHALAHLRGRWGWFAAFGLAVALLERVPLAWNHASEKDSLKIKELEHALIGKPLRTFPGHALERIAKKLMDFFDQSSLQLCALGRILIDRTIPCDRKAR